MFSTSLIGKIIEFRFKKGSVKKQGGEGEGASAETANFEQYANEFRIAPILLI
jgi:hypothetical protein